MAVCEDAAQFSGPGAYALLIRVESDFDARVGRLGTVRIAAGFYTYVGSALGPGGLAGRLRHHLRRAARPHWHVDYLSSGGRVEQAWLALGPERREHEWARRLAAWESTEIAVPRFGSSDCRCESHLFRWRIRPDVEQLASLVQTRLYGLDREALAAWILSGSGPPAGGFEDEEGVKSDEGIRAARA